MKHREAYTLQTDHEGGAMKIIPALCLSLLASVSNVLATAQIPDRITYLGEKYAMHTNPLESYFEKHPDRKPDGGVMSTALWRGYVATFTVTNGVLQLQDIEIQVHVEKEDNSYPYEWKSVLRDVCPEGKPLVIDWFSGILVLPYGDLKNYVHMGYASTYENYILLEVNEGKIGKEKRLNAEEYDKFRDKQFKAFKKTDEYKKMVGEMKKDGDSQERIDEFLRIFVVRYTSRFLDE